MRERYIMLLTIPIWVPPAIIGCLVNAVLEPSSFRDHWLELKRMVIWAWKN